MNVKIISQTSLKSVVGGIRTDVFGKSVPAGRSGELHVVFIVFFIVFGNFGE